MARRQPKRYKETKTLLKARRLWAGGETHKFECLLGEIVKRAAMLRSAPGDLNECEYAYRLGLELPTGADYHNPVGWLRWLRMAYMRG